MMPPADSPIASVSARLTTMPMVSAAVSTSGRSLRRPELRDEASADPTTVAQAPDHRARRCRSGKLRQRRRGGAATQSAHRLAFESGAAREQDRERIAGYEQQGYGLARGEELKEAPRPQRPVAPCVEQDHWPAAVAR